MSLFSTKKIDKARQLFDQNKDKIADGVSKATDTIDKKTGGKHADELRKVDEAAKKVTGQPGDTDGASVDSSRPSSTDQPAG